MIEHRIEIDDRHAHRFAVTLTVPNPAADQRLSLPVWIPGSYLVREFARHVVSIEARQGARARPVEALDKASWRVACAGRAALVVRFIVYAHDTSVRTAYLDADRGFFNGTSVCLQVEGRTSEPQRLVIGRLPRGWQVATAMRPASVDAAGVGAYRADDYDELVDHPFELGRFWSGEFTASGVPHRFVVSGAWPGFDGERLLSDARRICEAAIALWHPPKPSAASAAGRRRGRSGRPPFDRYVFLLHAVEDGYGGLEHRASTALLTARRDLPQRAGATIESTPRNDPPEGYVTLLGLISHEYFHAWNVKRLRPAELARIDYGRENTTHLLWFFEGFTSYYDDLLLRRAGLIEAPRYLKLLGKTVATVLGTPGRQVQSVAQASFDAWIKYYRPDDGTPNATVSYYAKGALVALALDLALRKRGGSLDSALRRLWKATAGGPVDESAIVRALAFEAAGGTAPDDGSDDPPATAVAQVARWLADWVHGTSDLPLRDSLQGAGVTWNSQAATPAQRLGVRAAEAGATVRLTHVLHGGAGHRCGLAAGDELLAANGWRLTRLDDWPRLADADGAVRWLVARDRRLVELAMSGADLTAAEPLGVGVSLALAGDGAGKDALARRRDWIGA